MRGSDQSASWFNEFLDPLRSEAMAVPASIGAVLGLSQPADRE